LSAFLWANKLVLSSVFAAFSTNNPLLYSMEDSSLLIDSFPSATNFSNSFWASSSSAANLDDESYKFCLMSLNLVMT